MPPRGLSPSGLILVDKPAGPSSFQVDRCDPPPDAERGPGTPGTLDPFATGLLLVLSGSATRLAPWLVGLDKRYVTDVDLAARTVDRRSGGRGRRGARAADLESELERRLAGLRGEIELRVPPPPRSRSAASAPTACTVAARSWRCPCGARGSTGSS